MPDASGRAASISRKRWWLWLVWAAVVVVLDQASKAYFDTRLAYGERWHIWPFFDFTLLYNPGAAFSFLAQGEGWQRWLLSVIALAAVGFLLLMLRRHAGERVLCAALASILGGAVGNLIDRVQLGHVVDFLLVYGQHWVFPAFNLADAAITGGAALLILDEVRRMRRARRTTGAGKA